MTGNPLQAAQFALAAHRLDQLPCDAGAEIAFAGRSNAGKSSALNALVGQRSLARTSKTPGRTQQLVVFELNAGAEGSDGKRLVDLPGYGYAKVPESLRRHWREVLDAYLRTRLSLRGLVAIMDIRHPLKPFDCQLLEYCSAVELPCHILLTKADKLSRSRTDITLTHARKALESNDWHATMQTFSAHTGAGVDQARRAIAELLASPPRPIA